MSAGLFQFGVAKAPGNAFHPLSSQVQRTAQATASVVARTKRRAVSSLAAIQARLAISPNDGAS